MERIQSEANEPLGPPLNAIVKEEGIRGPSICFQPDKVENDFSGSDIEATHSKDELDGHGVGAEEKVDKRDIESPNAYPD